LSPPLVVLGPTASGKSDVALAFAEEHGATEIVAVDAMQVYRGMDIGTAKPSPAERTRVAHHCLDLVDPDAEFTVTEFAPVARQAIADVVGRGATALVVGGTGLYLRTLTDPMDIPGTWADVRRELEQRAESEGPAHLHRELAASDPVAAARMEPSNTRRVVRALEVTIGSGRPFSSFGPGMATYGETPFRMMGLRWPRELLHRRIALRGTQDDGRRAPRRGPRAPEHLRRAVPYGAAGARVQGADRPPRRAVLDRRGSRIPRHPDRTVRSRQERWFRRDPRVLWVDVTEKSRQ
jgi:tRNA dimethylallyltransferase